MPIPPPPPDESASGAAPVVSRDKEKLFLPPRSAVPVPGAKSAFGRGFFGRMRGSPEGCFLLLFLGVGLAIFLFGVAGTFGPYKEGLRGNNDPRSFLGAMAFGAVFFLVALRMLQIVLAGAANEDRRAKTPKGDPWTWDYPWRQEWMAPDYTGGGSGSVLGRVAFLALLGLFNVAWISDSWLFKAIVAFFDLFGLLILYDSFQKLTQWLRFRHPVVTWRTFPAFVGDRIEGRVSFARPARATGPPRVTLRCVQDEWTTRPSKKGPTRELQPFAVYKETRGLPLAAPDEPLDYLDFGFDIPDGLLGTKLATDEATYWQVQVLVPVAGPDLESVFLAPVYRRTQGGRRKGPSAEEAS
jgi:hypothetical protein